MPTPTATRNARDSGPSGVTPGPRPTARCVPPCGAGAPPTPRRNGFAAFLLSLSIAALGACGATSNLREAPLDPDGNASDAHPDAPPDAPDAADVVNTCIPGRFTLERRAAEMMFVIDRSGSMQLNLDGSQRKPARWDILRDVLAAALPPFESSVRMGALFFPGDVPIGSTDLRETCGVPMSLDVVPGFRTAGAIVRQLQTTFPAGGTPTYDALTTAGRYLQTHVSRSVARTLVLATDGGPNCNGALPPATCVCLARDATLANACVSIRNGAYSCLDDGRTIAALESLQRDGIPTYVIGIDDSSRPEQTDVLNRMAVAGGRPNMDPRGSQFYSIRQADELRRAFDSIQRTVARCAYVTPSRPTDPEMIGVEVAGVVVRHDPTRTNGWDWTDRDFGELTLYGAACDRAAIGAPEVTARVGCNGP